MMHTFIKCQCGEPLIQMDNNNLYKKNNISIIEDNCYIQCPLCLSTSYFSKKDFINFYNLSFDNIPRF